VGRDSSCFGLKGRGDRGGLPEESAITEGERGGSVGRVGVAGGTNGDSVSATAGLRGDSTVMTGCRDDKDTALLDSSFGVEGNCGGVGPPVVCGRSGRGSIRGFVFGLGGGWGDAVLAGGNTGRMPTRNELEK
jgi:hypothetical protein